MACAPTAGVIKFVNTAANGCMVFNVFYLLSLSLLHKILQKILNSFESAQARCGRKRFLLFQKYFAICLVLLFTIGGLIASRLTLMHLSMLSPRDWGGGGGGSG